PRAESKAPNSTRLPKSVRSRTPDPGLDCGGWTRMSRSRDWAEDAAASTADASSKRIDERMAGPGQQACPQRVRELAKSAKIGPALGQRVLRCAVPTRSR